MSQGEVFAVLLVLLVLVGIFAIEHHFSKKQRGWQEILDDLDE